MILFRKLNSLFHPSGVMILILATWLLFNALSILRLKLLTIPLDIVGFFSLLIIPGMLLGIPLGWLKKPTAVNFSYMIGFSLLVLILLPLLSNTILPHFGIYKPLSMTPLLILFNIFILIAYIVAFLNRKKIILSFNKIG